MSLASAKEISINTAVAAVLSQLDDIFTLKRDQRATLKASLTGKDVF